MERRIHAAKAVEAYINRIGKKSAKVWSKALVSRNLRTLATHVTHNSPEIGNALIIQEKG